MTASEACLINDSVVTTPIVNSGTDSYTDESPDETIIFDVEMPTPANSRAFFKDRESQIGSGQNSRNSGESTYVPDAMDIDLIHSREKLESLLNYSNIVNLSDFFNLAKSSVDIECIINDIKGCDSNIFKTILRKITDCEKVFKISYKGEWKHNRGSIVDSYPIVGVDRLFDLFEVIVATIGIWNMNDSNLIELITHFENLSILIMDSRKKLHLTVRNQKKNKIENDSDIECNMNLFNPKLIDTIGLISTCIACMLKSNMISNSDQSYPSVNACIDPIVEGILLADKDKCDFIKKSINHYAMNTSTLTSIDSIENYIRTVWGFESSSVSTQFFDLPEIQSSIKHLQLLKGQLKEYYRERSCIFDCLLADMKNPSVKSLENADVFSRLLGSDKYLTNISKSALDSSALSNLDSAMQRSLFDFSQSLLSIHRFTGYMLGENYEDIKIQEELVRSTVLSTYVTMVGHMFHSSLLALSEWMSPYISRVRRKIKQQTAPVNSNQSLSVSDSVTIGSDSGFTEHTYSNVYKNNKDLSSFLDILTNTSKLKLSKESDTFNLINLLIPSLIKPAKNYVQSSADRINSLLVWLAWEGDLQNLYFKVHGFQLVSESNSMYLEMSPSKINDATIIDALVDTINQGCINVKNRLANALLLFFNDKIYQSESNAATTVYHFSSVGEDILDFCHRVIESLAARFYGDIDIKMSKDIFMTTLETKTALDYPLWKVPLFSNISKQAKCVNLSYKIIEGFPKLLGEYFHYKLFCIPQLKFISESQNNELLSSMDDQIIANCNASSLRFDGAFIDLIKKLNIARWISEISLLNSNDNALSLKVITEELKKLVDRIDINVSSIIDRHSNQLRNHTDRLEDHSKQLRSQNYFLSLQHSILSSNKSRYLKNESSPNSDGSKTLLERDVSPILDLNKFVLMSPEEYENSTDKLDTHDKKYEAPSDMIEKYNDLELHHGQLPNHMDQFEQYKAEIKNEIQNASSETELRILNNIDVTVKHKMDTTLKNQFDALVSDKINDYIKNMFDSHGKLDIQSYLKSYLDTLVPQMVEESIKSQVESCVTNKISSYMDNYLNSCLNEELVSVKSHINSTIPLQIESSVDKIMDTAIYKEVIELESSLDAKISTRVKSFVNDVVDSAIIEKTDNSINNYFNASICEKVDVSVKNHIDSSVSHVINSALKAYIDSSISQKIDTSLNQYIDSSIPDKIESSVNNYFETSVMEKIENSVHNHLDSSLHDNILNTLEKKLDSIFVQDIPSNLTTTLESEPQNIEHSDVTTRSPDIISPDHSDIATASPDIISPDHSDIATTSPDIISPERSDVATVSTDTISPESLTDPANEFSTSNQKDTNILSKPKLFSFEGLEYVFKNKISSTLASELIQRTKEELSMYLSQNISHCVMNHLNYILDQKDQEINKKKHLSTPSQSTSTPSCNLNSCQSEYDGYSKKFNFDSFDQKDQQNFECISKIFMPYETHKKDTDSTKENWFESIPYFLELPDPLLCVHNSVNPTLISNLSKLDTYPTGGID